LARSIRANLIILRELANRIGDTLRRSIEKADSFAPAFQKLPIIDIKPRSLARTEIGDVGYSCFASPGRALLVLRGLDDLHEAAWVEAGAAHEGPVDVGLSHQFA
jgi:hypothetical protein